MITDDSIEIGAPASVVWQVYADVEHWSDWTASVDRVVGLDGPDLAVGRRFEIKQPRFPKLVWKVTEVDPGRSWTWVQRSPGGTTVASHEVVDHGDGRTVVRQRLEQRGPVGALVARLTAGLTRRYLAMEAAGLKATAEARHRSDQGASTA
jgi:uncharacterized membrane protein